MSYMDAATFADHLEGRKKVAGGYMGRCPVHKDRSPSLAVKDGKTATLVNCHAGCDTRDILAALGIPMAQLFHDYTGAGRTATSADMKLREMIAKQREPKAHSTLGDVIWWTLKPGNEDDWFRCYEKQRDMMDMPFDEAAKMYGIVRDTVVWCLLEPHLNGQNWRDLSERFMEKLTKTERELRDYAAGR